MYLNLSQNLNIEQTLKLIQTDGLLSKKLKGFEPRLQQQKMMANVLDAYNQDQIALIEAGTGTGKSVAYLIPALIWAAQYSERTVISTHTITLQEQLVNKDIPFLLEALNLKLKVVLVKGMSNYVCLRKLQDTQEELRLYPTEEMEELQKIEKWSSSTVEGSRSELPFVPTMAIWERVGAESEACSHQECPHQSQCFFFKARRNISEAQILVVNHALLLADLSRRADHNNYSDIAILPPYKRVIIDEAHHLEEMATEHFASRLHRLELMRILGRLAADKTHKTPGKLHLLKDRLHSLFNKAPPREITTIITRLTIDLPALRHQLNDHIQDAFESFVQFLEYIKFSDTHALQEEPAALEQKMRILQEHYNHSKWKEEVVPKTQQLIASLREYRQGIDSIEEDLKGVDHERLQEQTKGIRLDIQALLLRLNNAIHFLGIFLQQIQDPNQVRWLEAQKYKVLTNLHLVDANLDVSNTLIKFLFSKFPTIILCSATLTSNQSFSFIRQRLGLMAERLPDYCITGHIYDSPFNYQKQALLVVPTDMPSPIHPDFNAAVYEHIWQAVQASRGNAFILFTSYSLLKNCYEALAQRFEKHAYTVFKQGDSNRRDLLTQFKNTNYSILMGTDSFWEGVDVVGDALRCVIIVKLPFKVPSEPMIQARTEAITKRGGNAFFEYNVPHAIVKFKQGFGRLIRNKWDRGCIVCLDNRLVTKNYGKLFLNSLPACEKIFAPSSILYPKMADFYRKTYHFVKNNSS